MMLSKGILQGAFFNCLHRLASCCLLSFLAVPLFLFSLFTSSASAYQCDERLALYAGWEVPASGPGPSFTQTWGLVNNTGCPISGFTLGNPDVYQWTGTAFVPYAAPVSGSYSTFSLEPDGGTGQVTANFNVTVPPGTVLRIFFDIITDDGSRLPYLPDSYPPGYRRLYTDVGGSIGGACLAPPPAISYVDHVDLGNGKVAVKADVENASGKPELSVNDSTSDMDSSSGGYTGKDSTGMKTDSSNTIAVTGLCPGMSASMNYPYKSPPGSAWYGKNSCPNTCNCYQSFTNDPVSTAIGNFIQQETDATVAGPGNSTIRLARAYNSLAALRAPATLTRHYPDGTVKIKAEPPKYFGKGWTSELGQYLLKIDMKPAFQGVQVLYADGHTANFKKSGSRYVSDSPGTHDVVTKEGGEYVLRPADCGCSSSEEKRFDSKGRLTALTDRNGNQIRLTYADGKLAAVENSAGRRVEFSLDNDGHITEARLPEDITLKYEYEDGLLAAFVDGKGNRRQYRYDNHGQMTEIISAKGHPVVRNSYDKEYRVSRQVVGESEEYSFEYEKGKTKVTDAYGNAETRSYT